MSNKHSLKLATLSVSLALALAGVVALLWLWGRLPQMAFAQGPGDGGISAQSAVGTAFTYQGRLLKSGSSVSDTCNFQFTLYNVAIGSTPIMTQTKTGVSVSDGYFTVPDLDFGSSAFTGDARWLQIAVQCSGDSSYNALSPRVALNAAPYAHSLRPGAVISQTDAGPILIVDNEGLGSGIWGYSAFGYGVVGQSTYGDAGVLGIADDLANKGVVGLNNSADGYGVCGLSITTTGTTYGVYGESISAAGYGVYGTAPTTGTVGVATVTDTISYGVYGEVASTAANASGVYGLANASSGWTNGVQGETKSADSGSAGVYGYASNTSGSAVAVWATSRGNGDIYRGYSSGDLEFKVTNAGDVYADGAYHCGQGTGSNPEPGTCIVQNQPADFAEMLPASDGLEPGDVLAIGLDGRLARSNKPYQANVVGVYSSQPGYLGGGQHRGKADYVPLAVVGIVSVKVSTENGPIRPGDLLVASGTPGHAMKADFNPPIGTVIGKALEGLEESTGVIKMLVILQ